MRRLANAALFALFLTLGLFFLCAPVHAQTYVPGTLTIKNTGITPQTVAPAYFALPNFTTISLPTPTSGEGWMLWDSTANSVKCWDGATWVAVGTSDHSALSNLSYATAGHTGFASAASLSGYLPLTGGSLSGDLYRGNPLGAAAYSQYQPDAIWFFGAAPTKGSLSIHPPIFADAHTHTLRFPHVDGTVWTSGNDGSASGLDADTVDGSHAAAFLTSAPTLAQSAAAGGFSGTETVAPGYSVNAFRYNAGDPRPYGYPQTAANALDNEFAGESLSAWTKTETAGTVTIDQTSFPGWLYIKAATYTGGLSKGWYAKDCSIAQATEWEIVSRVTVPTVAAGYIVVMPLTAGGNTYAAGFQSTALNAFRGIGAKMEPSPTPTPGTQEPSLFLGDSAINYPPAGLLIRTRKTNDGGGSASINCAWSADGGMSWRTIFNDSGAVYYVAVERLGIFWQMSGEGNSGGTDAIGMDFVRVR